MSRGLPWELSWSRIRLHCRRPRFNSWVGKIHWRRHRLHTPVFLGFPWGPAGKESACNVEVLGSIPGLGRSLEKGMTTYSSILAWKIPWTEEPGGLQSMGLQRVGHDWATNTHTYTVLSHYFTQFSRTKWSHMFLSKTFSILPSILSKLGGQMGAWFSLVFFLWLGKGIYQGSSSCSRF